MYEDIRRALMREVTDGKEDRNTQPQSIYLIEDSNDSITTIKLLITPITW